MESIITEHPPRDRKPFVIAGLAIALVVALAFAGWAVANNDSEAATAPSGVASGDAWLCDGLRLAEGDTQMGVGIFVIGSDWVTDPQLEAIIADGWQAWQDDNGTQVGREAIKARQRCDEIGA